MRGKLAAVWMLFASLPVAMAVDKEGKEDPRPAWASPAAPPPGGSFSSSLEYSPSARGNADTTAWPSSAGRTTPPPGGEFPAKLWAGSPGVPVGVQVNALCRSWAELAFPAPPAKPSSRPPR